MNDKNDKDTDLTWMHVVIGIVLFAFLAWVAWLLLG